MAYMGDRTEVMYEFHCKRPQFLKGSKMNIVKEQV